MQITYVVRPGDAPEGKGPQFKPFWDGLMNYNLRGGFALQLAGYIMILISALMGGHGPQVFGVLSGKSEVLSSVPIIVTFLGSLLATLGSVWVQNFRSIADDDASIKQSRGFRGGIKSLHQASLLDILSWTVTTILLFSFMQYFEDEWATRTVGSGSTAIYAAVGRTLHALSAMLYGVSFFMLENFHTEGTAEFWGWLLAFMFQLSGLFELLSLVVTSPGLSTVCNACFTCLFGIALVCAFLWAMSFEVVVAKSDVKMTQSAMRNESYKSRNAMAFYAPSNNAQIVGGPTF